MEPQEQNESANISIKPSSSNSQIQSQSGLSHTLSKTSLQISES
jgi:hypothetical protein